MTGRRFAQPISGGHLMRSRLIWLTRILAITALLATFGATPGLAESNADGVVYTLTNAAAGNRVLVFDRGADGTLTAAGSVATGGHGGALVSQAALPMSPAPPPPYASTARRTPTP